MGLFCFIQKNSTLPRQFTLGRNERLKSRKRIQQLFEEGRRFTVFPFRVSWQVEKNAGEPVLQFAIGVSSRHFKRAVDRNRIKRLAREAWRVKKNGLREWVKNNHTSLFVFFTYTGKVLPESGEINSSMTKVVEQLEEMIVK